MGPTIKATLHILGLLLLFGGACIGNKDPWCYDRPHCGPKTWSSLGKCNGKNQSPINIVTKKAISDDCLGPINFSGYEDRKRPYVLKNTGHYAEIAMKDGATISGPGLPAIYSLKSFHFHWGTYHHKGSEHAIDGLKHDMELHIVHTKNNMTLEEAKKDPQGLAVLAFFIKKSNEAPSVNTWKTLADLLGKIPEKGNAVNLDGQFSLGGLLKVADVRSYYRYFGSLTSPNCSEAVTWIVYPQPIEVTHKTLKKFTDSLYFTTIAEGRKMQKNYRPLQPLNNRKVGYFTESKHGHPYPKHCSASGEF
ncbi:carbonic anhydrase 4-like [Anolis sagrei]|uniref:carbonic anhydrase 4-like n=1 Tax=Anolis sagrei TaxID=38937 RepID=UPI0035216ADF